ncbi:MAG: Uncharacterized protein Athens071426_460 [Parcubacteria group bacterium Athens0714_26]|nr:MAG: Uncharacterized protein Athens101426_203 [Parcubacteria group bacterium Athens1014_26]TSD02586.1 MAG: Uncharacterized protein Athens071426_460 [Parcubacteria group bacterium Athens0714_26]
MKTCLPAGRNFWRSFGYIEISNPHKAGDVSYVRSLDAGRFYPRFHIYTQDLFSQEIEINLHLDMKKPSYEGMSAHSGEYDGELVSNEAQRIMNIAGELFKEKSVQLKSLGFKKKESFLNKILKFFNLTN